MPDIAKAFPHKANAASVFGYQHKFTYMILTVPDTSHDLKPLEHVIRHRFIKSVSNGHECNSTERKLITLSVKLDDLSTCKAWRNEETKIPNKLWKTGRNEKFINERIARRTLKAGIDVAASSLQTTLPIKQYGFCVDKESFWDSLYVT